MFQFQTQNAILGTSRKVTAYIDPKWTEPKVSLKFGSEMSDTCSVNHIECACKIIYRTNLGLWSKLVVRKKAQGPLAAILNLD